MRPPPQRARPGPRRRRDRGPVPRRADPARTQTTSDPVRPTSSGT
jgi:hypothetical protein